MADLIKQRYESIFRRIFDNAIELYIFEKLINSTGKPTFTFDDFPEYRANEETKKKYYSSYLIESNEEKVGNRTIKEIDEEMAKWFRENKQKYKELLDIFKKKNISNEDVIIPFDEFNNIFSEDKERKCHYCGITETIIGQLILKGKIKTKRLLTRGRKMEIDRAKPNKGYTKGNIVLSCYWCNNAKTDEFSYDEFKSKIAPAIRSIWVERFGVMLPEPEGKVSDE